jgi:hypothetical protein
MVQVVVRCPFCGKEFNSLHRGQLDLRVQLPLPQHQIVRGINCPSTGTLIRPMRQFDYEDSD